MKAIQFDQLNPLGNSLMTEFARAKGNRDLGGHGYAENSEADEGLLALYNWVQIVRRNSSGAGGNGGSTVSTTAGFGNPQISNVNGNSPKSLHAGQTVFIGTGPVYIGQIRIFQYNNGSHLTRYRDGTSIMCFGTDIGIGWKTFGNSNIISTQWIQTIDRSIPMEGPLNSGCKSFTDPEWNIQGGFWPFYYPNTQREAPSGFADLYTDTPGFPQRSYDQTFVAELTLVGRTVQSCGAIPLITLRFGFTLMANSTTPIVHSLYIVSMFPNGYSGLSYLQYSDIRRACIPIINK